MFHRRLANLFKPLVIGGAAALAIKILRNDWVIIVWQSKPIERLVAVVTGVCSHREADLCPSASELLQTRQLPNDDVGSRHQRRRFWATRASQRRHDNRFGFAISEPRDLGRLHGCSDRDFS